MTVAADSQLHESVLQQRGEVPFPAFAAERVYMRPFTLTEGLPDDLARWRPTVEAMLRGIDAPGVIYLMIDQSEVVSGVAQRRPGLHVDGYWDPAARVHGGHRGAAHDGGDAGWERCDFSEAEALIFASNIAGCRAFVGTWAGRPGPGGDCAHIATDGLRQVDMAAGVAYAGSAGLLHESMPLAHGGRRTLVRLNVPGWTPVASRATSPLL